MDIGGAVDPAEEDEYGEGKNLVVFAIDPGLDTGWSAWKVPVARLRATGATRTLPWCRWRHGTIQRSAPPGTGHIAQAISDSRHVTMILDQSRRMYEEFVYESDEEGEAEGWESDVFVYVLESFDLRMMSMDTNLLAPVRVNDRILDRMYLAESELPLYMQSPSDAKTTVTDARLKTWNVYNRSDTLHSRDADRHAILFIRRFADDRELQSRLGFGS